jgi:crotonobetainyl-CoA:carnitine CoA-transferase CaiB-like acyl-CoA transferase
MKAHLLQHQERLGNRCEGKDQDPLQGCYQCAGNNRWCVIAISDQKQWQALCRISGIAGLKDDRFRTPSGRRKNRPQLDALIAGWTIRHSAETIALRLQKAGVAAGVVQNAKDLAGDPQLAARRFFIALKHPVLGKIYSDRSALWPWREEPLDWKAAPRLGQDNRHIFMDLLGHTESEFRSMVKKGVIQ